MMTTLSTPSGKPAGKSKSTDAPGGKPGGSASGQHRGAVAVDPAEHDGLERRRVADGVLRLDLEQCEVERRRAGEAGGQGPPTVDEAHRPQVRQWPVGRRAVDRAVPGGEYQPWLDQVAGAEQCDAASDVTDDSDDAVEIHRRHGATSTTGHGESGRQCR